MSHALADPVRQFAAGLPGAWEDHPWGESVAKVGKKVFVFFGILENQTGLRFTVKLRARTRRRWRLSGSSPPATASIAVDG